MSRQAHKRRSHPRGRRLREHVHKLREIADRESAREFDAASRAPLPGPRRREPLPPRF